MAGAGSDPRSGGVGTPAGPVGMVGRYALHREIAAGGMASIHLGKLCGPVGFAPIVAIKSLHAHYAKNPEFVRMFLDEARLAGRIRHPNVVSVLDVYAADGQLFLVLEYIHGESLSRLLVESRRQKTRVSPTIASAVLCDVLHGLHAAHEAKGERGEPLDIVHRDVSPQNVIVGVDGTARVLDFGVAKAAGRMQTTQDGQVKGKFAYMPPEQLRGEKVNRQADLYSAAVVLWETLTCTRLFDGASEGATVEQVLFSQVQPPSALRDGVPRALDAVVMRGLARERSERFSTAKEMALALQAAVAAAPPPAVGEWVEARAIDALEERALLVAEVEASTVPTEPTQSEVDSFVSGLRSHAPSQPAPPSATIEEGSTSGQSVPDGRSGDAASGRTGGRRGVLAVTSVAALLCLGVASIASLRRSPAPTPELAETPSQAAGTVAPTPSVSSSASPERVAKSLDPPPSTAAVPPARPKTSRTWAPSPRPQSAQSGPRAGFAPSSPAAPCQRHDAQGVITFDTDCLRAAERRP